MALTRKFLTAMNIEEAQADQIIEEHTATVNNIKSELESYKADSEKLASTEKKLEKVQKELDALKEGNQDDEYKTKYDNLKAEFDKYKQTVKDKETKAEKTKLFREILKEAKVSEKRFDAIIKLSDDEIDKIEVDEDGKIKDKDNLVKSITENWSEYIQTTETQGANTHNPPANNGGDSKKISRAKQIAEQYHSDLYGKLKED